MIRLVLKKLIEQVTIGAVNFHAIKIRRSFAFSAPLRRKASMMPGISAKSSGRGVTERFHRTEHCRHAPPGEGAPVRPAIHPQKHGMRNPTDMPKLEQNTTTRLMNCLCDEFPSLDLRR